MAREPSRALGYNVMARVREGARAVAPRRFVWIDGRGGFVLCAAIATAALRVERPPADRSLPPARTAADRAVANRSTADRPIVGRCSRLPLVARRSVAAPERERRPPATAAAADRVSTIEPIETEPIALSAIDVPQLEREAHFDRGDQYRATHNRAARSVK